MQHMPVYMQIICALAECVCSKLIAQAFEEAFSCSEHAPVAWCRRLWAELSKVAQQLGHTIAHRGAGRGGWHGWWVNDLAALGRPRKVDAAAADAGRLGRRKRRVHWGPYPQGLRLFHRLQKQTFVVPLARTCDFSLHAYLHALSAERVVPQSAVVVAGASERVKFCTGMASYLCIRHRVLQPSNVKDPAGVGVQCAAQQLPGAWFGLIKGRSAADGFGVWLRCNISCRVSRSRMRGAVLGVGSPADVLLVRIGSGSGLRRQIAAVRDVGDGRAAVCKGGAVPGCDCAAAAGRAAARRHPHGDATVLARPWCEVDQLRPSVRRRSLALHLFWRGRLLRVLLCTCLLSGRRARRNAAVRHGCLCCGRGIVNMDPPECRRCVGCYAGGQLRQCPRQARKEGSRCNTLQCID